MKRPSRSKPGLLEALVKDMKREWSLVEACVKAAAGSEVGAGGSVVLHLLLHLLELHLSDLSHLDLRLAGLIRVADE